MAGTGQPYRRWYDFSPNYPHGYRCWWGFETLPEVNEEDRSYREFICGEGGVIDYWLGLGASGFRLDVADELPDDFIEEIRRAVKRHGSEKYLLGEVWEDATNKWSYGRRRTYLLGKGLDAVMNYPFKDATLAFVKGGDARTAAHDIMRICEHYPAPALHVLMNFMSTHDTVRAITAIAGESCEGRDRYWQSARRLTPEQYENGRRLMTLAYAMIFTLPGIPSIYYGDEIGMAGLQGPVQPCLFRLGKPGNAHPPRAAKPCRPAAKAAPLLPTERWPSPRHRAACCATSAAPKPPWLPCASTGPNSRCAPCFWDVPSKCSPAALPL